MKKANLIVCLVSLLLSLGQVAFAQAKVLNTQDTVFQVSTLGALQEGVYDGALSIKDLKSQGNIGIGTFDGLEGELVLLDGQCYQIKADGKVYKVADNMTTPFAAVTFFDVDKTINITQPISNYAQLQEAILAALPTPNIPYVIKISGNFKYVKTRSVPKQTKPYPRLVEVTKNQPTFEDQNIKGTLVGFWLPQYLAGANMAGFHLHFISDDLKFGGHLLECELVSGTVQIDYSYGLQLVLPNQSDFFRTDLSVNKEEELKKIEK